MALKKLPEPEVTRISLWDRFEAHKKTIVGVVALCAVVLVGLILYFTFRTKAREERWTDLISTVLYSPYSSGPSLESLAKRGGSDILPHVLLQRAMGHTASKSWDLALEDLSRLQGDYRDHYLNTLPATERYSLVDELRRWVESEKAWLAAHTYVSPPVNSDRVALVETSAGAWWVGFFPELAPEHVDHFVHQAKAGAFNGTSVTSVKSTRFEFGGEASRDEDPFNDELAAPEQPLSPGAARFKIRPERGMVSFREIEGGESPTRVTVFVLEDQEMDKRQTIFGRVLTDRYPHNETLDAIGKAVTYGSSSEAEHKDTAKYGTVADHPVQPIRIARVSIWAQGKIEDGHQWDVSAIVKPEPPAKAPEDKPLEEKPTTPPADEGTKGEESPDKPSEEAPSK
ncbi:MAG: peptidylprolyl isomerase [Planctomycetes bacterium]|jgi:peptidyl-prolyl cis-trans isomerase B (cyclophilin B)|nr:peptidylprolyl isomerase [Planctomycetota bacterium]